MKPKGMFVTALLVVDTALVSYAVGFNSRHVLVVNPSLPSLSTELKQDRQPASPDDRGEKSKGEGDGKESLAEPAGTDSKDKGAQTRESKKKPVRRKERKKKS